MSSERNKGCGSGLGPVAELQLRASPSGELIPLERLSPSERGGVPVAHAGSAVFGVWRRTGFEEDLATPIGADLALVLYALGDRGRLPRLLIDRLGASRALVLVREWIAAGFVEVEVEGSWLGREQALERLSVGVEPASLLAEQTWLLLEQVAAESIEVSGLDEKPEVDLSQLATSIYRAGTEPATAALAAQHARSERTFEVLQVDLVSRRLGQRAQVSEHDRGRGGWLSWRSANRPRKEPVEGTPKLYVSPLAADLPKVLAVVSEVLTECRWSELKVGRGLEDLVRPDKCVAYFERLEDLTLAARQLTEALASTECSAHGVPMSCQLDERALLSWGLDPQGSSWRWVLAGRVARALQARLRQTTFDEAAAPTELVRQALQTLAAEGIQVRTWDPRPATAGELSGSSEPIAP